MEVRVLVDMGMQQLLCMGEYGFTANTENMSDHKNPQTGWHDSKQEQFRWDEHRTTLWRRGEHRTTYGKFRVFVIERIPEP